MFDLIAFRFFHSACRQFTLDLRSAQWFSRCSLPGLHNFIATSLKPRCSNRLMIFPTSPRWTPSGLIAIKVRSLDMAHSKEKSLVISERHLSKHLNGNLTSNGGSQKISEITLSAIHQYKVDCRKYPKVKSLIPKNRGIVTFSQLKTIR